MKYLRAPIPLLDSSPFEIENPNRGRYCPVETPIRRPIALAIALLGLSVAITSLRAASPSEPAATNAATITIIGAKPAVEQGEKSLFTALPERDLTLRPLTESPGLETATTLVGRPEIERYNAYSVLDAMKYVPGAWTESRGRKEKQLFSVRGQRYPYPGNLVDGAWFREFTESSFFMNAAFVEQIEITRSSSDLLLTPGGMAGSLNLVPRQYAHPETQVQTEYGELNTSISRLTHGAPFANGSYGLGLGYRHTDGEEGKNGKENLGDLYGRILWQATPKLQLSLMGYALRGDRQLRLAEPPAMLSLQRRYESADPMNYQMLIAKARMEWENQAVTEATFNFGNRRYESHQIGAAVPHWLEKDLEYGARVMQGFQLSSVNNLRFSGMYNHWESPTGKRFYVGNPGDLSTYAGAVTDEHQFGRLTLNAGYRFSQTYIKEFGGFNLEGAGLTTVKVRDEWDDPLHTFSLGGKYQVSDTISVHANWTWGQISSQPGMLNAALQRPETETRWKYDLGVKATWPQFGELTLTGFFVDQQDAALPKGTINGANGVPFVLYETGDAQSVGVELELRSKRFASGLQFFGNGVLMTTQRKATGGWQDDAEVPDVILGGGASYLYRRFEAILLAKHVGIYENDRFLAAGARPVDLGDFVELNASLNLYLGKALQHRIYFAVDNLTDENYSTVAGYPNYGLFIKGGLSLRF